MQEYEIEFYDKADGSEPAKEFILSLDKKMQAKVLRTVALLREEGPFLREPYSKALDDGIFEIRTKFGSDITRVLYFFVVAKKVILTNGFIKKHGFNHGKFRVKCVPFGLEFRVFHLLIQKIVEVCHLEFSFRAR